MCTWRAFGISAGQELQINQHADPQPSHPFDGRGRRVHRIRPADSICRQVSLMMPPILDYLFSVIAFFLFLFWYFLWPSISYDTHFRDGNYLGKDRRIRSRMKRPACGTAATASGWMFTFTVPEPQLPVPRQQQQQQHLFSLLSSLSQSLLYHAGTTYSKLFRAAAPRKKEK